MRNFEFEYLIHQLRAYANQHEQPPYGRAIEGEEELERNAADAIKFLLEENKKLQKENKKLKLNQTIETPLGTLLADTIGDRVNFPGIWISLKRNKIEIPLVRVECLNKDGMGLNLNTDTPDDPRIFTFVYANEADDFTHKIVHTGIEEYFAEMEE